MKPRDIEIPPKLEKKGISFKPFVAVLTVAALLLLMHEIVHYVLKIVEANICYVAFDVSGEAIQSSARCSLCGRALANYEPVELGFFICLLFTVIINITDFKSYKIKNICVVPMLAIGLLLGWINQELRSSIYGMLIPLVLFPFFALRMLGAGDIKALCAMGAVLGFGLSIRLMVFSFVAGGIIALCFMLLNKNVAERFKYFFKYIKLCIMTKKVHKYDYGGGAKSYFRFAYAIAGGYILTVLNYIFEII